MRQAGRYLPEYRALREKAGSFLSLCFNPEMAAEVTLQPIRRFGFDAAILFSDILVVPHALGRSVTSEAGEGPRLEPLDDATKLNGLSSEADERIFAPVYEAVRRVKRELPGNVALLGFCGAPWTVATYMIAGRGTPDQAPARLIAYREPQAFARMIDILVSVSSQYLIEQLRAGADAVQIFDTWAGVLPPAEFARWCIAPVQKIIARVRAEIPDAKIIGFPRGAGASLGHYVRNVPVNAVSLPSSVRKCRARPPCRATSIRSRCWPAGRPSIAQSMKFWKTSLRGLSSSISVTASCRKRQSRMSSRRCVGSEIDRGESWQKMFRRSAS